MSRRVSGESRVRTPLGASPAPEGGGRSSEVSLNPASRLANAADLFGPIPLSIPATGVGPEPVFAATRRAARRRGEEHGEAHPHTAPCPLTASAKFAKNWSAIFLANPSIKREPSCAIFPPTFAVTSYFRTVPSEPSTSCTFAAPLAKPAIPPSPSPLIV